MVSRLVGFRWFRGLFWLTMGIGVGCIVAALWPFEYTSEASLRVSPAAVPRELIPRSPVDAKSLLDELAPVALSTALDHNADSRPRSVSVAAGPIDGRAGGQIPPFAAG